MSKIEKGVCKNCGLLKPIVNRTYKLCQECNKSRLNNETTYVKPKPHKTNSIGLKRLKTREKDREVYRQVFESKPNICEGCGVELSGVFENDGKIVDIWQYSHILSKGAFPQFRHNPKNFNRLCFHCHQIWEFCDEVGRSVLNCYEQNVKVRQELYESAYQKSNG